ncbi:MAG TPA: ABC transporter permease [Candidatus Micrarchaeia archaeon]|nr:ABC transporter permease [Candidatus Micrarchaeia archaeon]
MTPITWGAVGGGRAAAAAHHRRRFWHGVVCCGLGLGIAVLFALHVGGASLARLNLDSAPAVSVPVVVLPVRLTNAVLAAVAVAAGLLLLLRPRGRHPYAPLGLALTAFGLAFLVWAARGTEMSFEGMLANTLIDSVPLVFGALAGVMCERSGVINIAIEGQFLAGAFLGAMVGSVTGDLWLGMLGGAAAGALIGALLAFLCLRYQADQIIVGFVIVTFATGLTTFLDTQVLTPNQSVLNSPATFGPVAVPLLDRIPLVGPIVFDQNVFLYLALALLLVIQVGLFHTRWGLRVRAVGEHPRAADTVGLRVLFIRYRNVILGGAIGGLGGAALSIGSTGEFTADMSAGLGYVALASMIFGRWNPLWAASACLLFGFADSLQSTLSVLNVPIASPFLLMAPYVATIVAVAGLVGRVRPPAADGQPYRRE